MSSRNHSKILSFDIGVKNLSYCLVEKTIGELPIQVIDWDIIDLSQNGNIDVKDCESVIASLLQALTLRFRDHIDYVVIENQPAQKNPSMKTIQVALLTYFVMQKCQGQQRDSVNVSTVSDKPIIRFYSAANKLKPTSFLTQYDFDRLNESPRILASPSAYVRRKRLSIESAKYLINQKQGLLTIHNCSAQNTFEQSRKQDDMADALLQAIHFISNCAAL